MQVQLAAGLEVDLATKEDVTGIVDDLRTSLIIPTTRRPFVAQATIPAGFSAATYAFFVGTPSTACSWDVRRITIVSGDDHTSVVNVAAAIYVGSGSQQTVMLPDVAWVGITVPSSNRFNREIIVGHNEGLWINLSGSALAAAQNYIVTGSAVEVQADFLGSYLS